MSSSGSEILTDSDGRPIHRLAEGRYSVKRRTRVRPSTTPDKKKLRVKTEFTTPPQPPNTIENSDSSESRHSRSQSLPSRLTSASSSVDTLSLTLSSYSSLNTLRTPTPQPSNEPIADLPLENPVANNSQNQHVQAPTESLGDFIQHIFPPPHQNIIVPVHIPMEANPVAENNLESAFERLCLSSYASKLPIFSGDRMGENFMEFLNKFYEIGHIMGLTEPKMARLLPAHLKGVAKAVYDNLSDNEKADWRAAITKLQEHFSTDQFLDMARERIMNMRMELGEAPVVFSNRIRKEILDAYPHDNLTEQRKFLQHMVFTNGLPYKIKEKLKLLGPLSSNYETLLRDAGRMYDISKANPVPEEDMLIAKIDRAIDTIVSNRSPAPSTSYFRNPNRNYYLNARPNQYNNFNNPRNQFNPRFRSPSRNNVRFAPNTQYRNERARTPVFQNRSPNQTYNRDQERPYRRQNPQYRRQTSPFRRPNSPSRRQNFQNRRPRSPFRQRSNSSSHFPINSITASSPRTILKPTTSLFIVAIVSILIAPTSAFSLKYQLCSAGKSGWPIAYPDPVTCTSSPNASQVLITGADLYVERTEPLLLQAYHCFNKTRKICTSSYLHVSFSVNSDEEFMTPIDPTLCESLTQTKKYLEFPLEKLSANVYGSDNQIQYSYPWFFGEKCTVTTTYILKKEQLQLLMVII
ncbi:hypothetical protein OSTOST_02618 [Ostertagia ostertagi]